MLDYPLLIYTSILHDHRPKQSSNVIIKCYLIVQVCLSNNVRHYSCLNECHFHKYVLAIGDATSSFPFYGTALRLAQLYHDGTLTVHVVPCGCGVKVRVHYTVRVVIASSFITNNQVKSKYRQNRAWQDNQVKSKYRQNRAWQDNHWTQYWLGNILSCY